MFPPVAMGMREALTQHRVHRRSCYRGIVGAFVVAANRLGELIALIADDPRDEPLAVSLVGTVDDLRVALHTARETGGAVQVVGIEVSPGAGWSIDQAVELRDEVEPEFSGLSWWLETPLARTGQIEEVVAAGFGVKLRLGGVPADAIPDERALAGILQSIVATDGLLKLTAGLHRATRYVDAAGAHYGWAGILAAIAAAEEGSDGADVAAALGDPGTTGALIRRGQVPQRLRSIGTCSMFEPVVSAIAVGLLPALALPRPEAAGQAEQLQEQFGPDATALAVATDRSLAAVLSTPGFGSEHLPYGSLRDSSGRVFLGVRLGEHAIDAGAVVRAGIGSIPVDPALADALGQEGLDGLLALTRRDWVSARSLFTELAQSPDVAEELARHATALDELEALLPFSVADYVDFYASRHHAENVGRIFRPGQPALPAQWTTIPIAYHGRAGTVVVSGAEVRRPRGIRRIDGVAEVGASRFLDIEAELGFVVGTGARGPVSVADAGAHIFGVALVNDWSARDLQAYEYQPLGPFLSKSFATSIGAWVTPFAALDAARVSLPSRDSEVPEYLALGEQAAGGIDISLDVELGGEIIMRPPYRAMSYSPEQMLAHITHNGASLRPGDLFASGTISGSADGQEGSLLERTRNGQQPLRLADGSERASLHDGDTVTLRGRASAANGERIELGEVRGTVRAAEL